jgi:cysteine-rich repeat protein
MHRSLTIGLLSFLVVACGDDDGGNANNHNGNTMGNNNNGSSLCGNGVLDPGEICDDGNTVGGDACSADCRQDLTLCGNGDLDAGEACDGVNLGGAACTSLGFTGGSLSCGLACQLDLSGCTGGCGNGQIEAGEACDGANLGGATCATLGLGVGTLHCSGACQLDTAGCVAAGCGNGIIEAGEACDGQTLGGATCQDHGFSGGILACNPECTVDTTGCTQDDCGNGQIDAGEQCDGDNLEGQSCVTLGFSGGTLVCSGACLLDLTGCEGIDPCSGNPYTPTAPSTDVGTTPAGSTAEQQTAVAYITAIRNLIGLNAIDLNAALNQASQAHSTYCSTNASWCPNWHDEVPGNPGFTGEQFWTRCSAAGYTGNAAFEVMAPGGTPQYAIDMWMATVYHRTPFITPEIHEAGFGSGSSYNTMDFGCCGASDPDLVTNYPVHGQTGVPTSWGGNEGPQPPPPPGGYPSGPVLSIIFPSTNGLAITATELYGPACTPIDHVAGGADLNGTAGFQLSFLRSTVVLYANDPLTSGQTYTVNVEYTRNGTPGHRTFTFVTQ